MTREETIAAMVRSGIAVDRAQRLAEFIHCDEDGPPSPLSDADLAWARENGERFVRMQDAAGGAR